MGYQMKVTINLAEDLELRTEIRQMVRAAIISVAREEIEKIITSIIHDKFATFINNKEMVINKTIDSFVKDILSRKNITQQINEIVTTEVLKKLNAK